MNTPDVNQHTKQQDFDTLARQLGLKPRDPWVGGQVDYEWDQLRMVLDVMPLRLPDMQVLEFGCNIGASAILFSYLGAKVSATDDSADWVALARLTPNATASTTSTSPTWPTRAACPSPTASSA